MLDFPRLDSVNPGTCGSLLPPNSNPMEAFLDALDDLIVDSAEELTAIELLGALQLTQQRIALDILTVGEEDEEEAA